MTTINTMSIDPIQQFQQMQLPAQDLAKLSFCDSSKPARVQQWAEALPATHIKQTSALLYKALPEMPRLRIDPEARLLMLESLRPYVQSCIHGLSKEFLNKPLILPDAAVKSATIAQALQKHMTTAYSVLARDICASDKKATPKLLQSLSLSLHRAITGLGLQLVRSYQLYIPVHQNLWSQLHKLYQVAEYWECTHTVQKDSSLKYLPACNLQEAYQRVLLLACCRPNQLRQTEVGAVYNALEHWSSFAEVSQGNQHRDNLFVINLSSGLPPMYKNRFQGKQDDDIRELETRNLIAAMKKTAGSPGALVVPTDISSSILKHLNNAWCVNRQRHFERRLSNSQLEVTVGMTSLHHHLTSGTPFKRFLLGTLGRGGSNSVNNLFGAAPVSSEIDPWDEAFDAGGKRGTFGNFDVDDAKEKPGAGDHEHPITTVDVLDSSPGGYCLNWKANIPSQVRAGEVLGLREAGRRSWSIGVIRWVSQSKGASQLGIQVISPQAKPLGAAIINKSGGQSEFLRAFQLPEIRAVNQPPSLLTAIMPFHENAKVTLNDSGQERKAQLTQQMLSTGSIAQFAFRELESKMPGNKSSKGMGSKQEPDDFDSVWD